MRIPHWMLLAFYSVLYLIPLNLRPLWIPDESRYAEISREMLATGNWVVPRFLDLRYFEKPIAGYWINSISQWLFGDSNFAVRFGQAFATGLSAWLIYVFALRLWRQQGTERARSKAVAASLIYLSCGLVYGIGTDAVLDAMVTLWLNAAMVAFYLTLDARDARQKIIAYTLMGVACGMGFLTKGFIALAVPVVAIAPFMIQQKRFLELVTFGIVPIIAAVVISAPWSILIHLRDNDYWHYFFWVEHIQRFSSPNAQHKQPIWFYLPVLVLGILPWAGLAPSALRKAWTDSERRGVIYLLCWVLFPVLFFSIAKGKLATYVLPAFAPLALLLGAGVADLLLQQRSRPLRVNGGINLAFGLALAAGLLIASRINKTDFPYGPGDQTALIAGITVFACWALFGMVQLVRPQRLWFVPAFTMLPVALLLPFAVPQQMVDNKMPEFFIQDHIAPLEASTGLITNDVGVAAALAWTLKRTDIIMMDNKGELDYGLSYPDAASHYLLSVDFANWLQQRQAQGPVAILTRGKDASYFNHLPKPDQHVRRGRYDLLLYGVTTP